MSEIINAKPRFGLEGDTLFDYATSTNIPIVEGAKIETPEGVWHVAQVAELIRAGKSIETAFAPLSPEVQSVVNGLENKLNDAEAKLTGALDANLQLAQENDELRKANDDFRAQINDIHPSVPNAAEQARQDFAKTIDEAMDLTPKKEVEQPDPASGQPAE